MFKRETKTDHRQYDHSGRSRHISGKNQKIDELIWRHTVPKVPAGTKVPLPANRFFLSIACCVLVASVFAGACWG
jgi:hypothetical protein